MSVIPTTWENTNRRVVAQVNWVIKQDLISTIANTERANSNDRASA
jgi:hypothetical protein